MYHTRFIVCGYSQVPRVDFSTNYLPVMNNITFHILLLMVMNFGLLAKIINVQTIFPDEDLKEEIYMECPQGMKNVGKDDCINLDECIYGLVQATR